MDQQHNGSNLRTHIPALLTTECQLGVEHPSDVYNYGLVHLSLED